MFNRLKFKAENDVPDERPKTKQVNSIDPDVIRSAAELFKDGEQISDVAEYLGISGWAAFNIRTVVFGTDVRTTIPTKNVVYIRRALDLPERPVRVVDEPVVEPVVSDDPGTRLGKRLYDLQIQRESLTTQLEEVDNQIARLESAQDLLREVLA